MKYGVGIDVSKGKSMISILTQDGIVIKKPFEVRHNINDLSSLVDLLNSFPKDELKIVLEETGTYHLPIYYFLLNHDFFVVPVNALKISKYLDRDLHKAKTDRKDSLKLAEYCCDNWFHLNLKIKNNDVYERLQFLSRQYSSHINIQVGLKTDFSNLCDILFPGFYQLLNTDNFIVGLYIFKYYSHPDLVKQKEQHLFIDDVVQKLPFTRRDKGIKSLASKIYSLALNTVSTRPCDDLNQLSADLLVNSLITTLEATDMIISKMKEIAKSLPEYNTVRSMPGVGDKLAPRIIAEIGDIRKFKNAGSLIAYTGIDSPPYQSGSFDASSRRISKRGNKYLRKTGFEVMKALKSSYRKDDSDVLNFILKKEAEGKLKKAAKIAGLNKFLRIYYGSVKKLYKDLNLL